MNLVERILKKVIRSSPVVASIVQRAQMKFQKKARWRFRKFCCQLSEEVSNPFFVKVGANDGVSGDPCSDILLSRTAWKGLLVEPVPYLVEALQANFSDSDRFIIEQVGIGQIEGESKFYYVDPAAKEINPDLPDWCEQLGSFKRSHLIKELNGILEPYIIQCPVEVCRLSSLLSRIQIVQIDLLHVDTEGFDLEVLKSLDFSRYTPLAIFIEHKHLNKNDRDEMLNILKDNGYSVRDCGGDYFALLSKKRAGMRKLATQ